jgi:hypothetical protein
MQIGNAKELVKKGQQCLKKAFDVVPQREVESKVLSKDLKTC